MHKKNAGVNAIVKLAAAVASTVAQKTINSDPCCTLVRNLPVTIDPHVWSINGGGTVERWNAFEKPNGSSDMPRVKDRRL